LGFLPALRDSLRTLSVWLFFFLASLQRLGGNLWLDRSNSAL
jgi:hypothetical protein